MQQDSFVVPARSWDEIAQITDSLREKFGLAERPYFPIMTFLEKVLDGLGVVPLLVSDRAEMGQAEGYTCPDREYIELRDDVYEAALLGDGRARFTAAHELGHFALHTKIPLARANSIQSTKPFLLSEPQANQFAAELLMPRRMVLATDTAEIIQSRHGVSYSAARKRLMYLKNKGMI